MNRLNIVRINVLLLFLIVAFGCHQIERGTECTVDSHCSGRNAVCRFGVCLQDGVTPDSVGVGNDETDNVDTGGRADTDSDTGTDTDTDTERDGGLEWTVLEAIKDTNIRADWDIREDDNYGCDRAFAITLGRSYNGGDFPEGAPGATQAYIAFDLSDFSEPVNQARLALTLCALQRREPVIDVPIGIFKIIESGGREHWQEGNGSETSGAPDYCEYVDSAYGVTWDRGRPDLSAEPYSIRTILATETPELGDQIEWDITSLVNAWILDSETNYGLALVTTQGGTSFHEFHFGTREAETYVYLDKDGNEYPMIDGPKLLIQ